jgi:hypothetical protein
MVSGIVLARSPLVKASPLQAPFLCFVALAQTGQVQGTLESIEPLPTSRMA